MQKTLKPRNPLVALAKFRHAGTHAKPNRSLRRRDKQALAKAMKANAVKDWAASCHKRICFQIAFAMASLCSAPINASS